MLRLAFAVLICLVSENALAGTCAETLRSASSGDERFATAKQLAAKLGCDIPIKDLGVSRRQRFEVALIAAREQSSTCQPIHLTKFNLWQSQEYQIIKVIVEREGASRIADFKSRLHTQGQFFELFQIAAHHNPLYIFMFLPSLLTSEEHRFVVTKIVAVTDPEGTANHIREVRLNQEHRKAIAQMIAERNPHHVARVRGSFDLSADQYKAILQATFAWGSYGEESLAIVLRIVDGVSFYRATQFVESLQGLPFSEAKEKLKAFLVENKIPVDLERVEALSQPVRRFDILCSLIIMERLYSTELQGTANGLDTIVRLAGFPPQALDVIGSKSSDAKGHLFREILSITMKLGIGWGRHFSADLYSAQKRELFFRYISLVDRTLAFVVPEHVLGVRPETIQDKIVQLKDMFVEGVQKLLQASDFNFNYETFQTMEKRWGSLEPFLTLASRFAAHQGWRAELPLLGQVFFHSLRDQFEQFKFEGSTAEHRERVRLQLKGLDAHGLSEWKKSRVQVDYWSAQKMASSLVKDAVRDIVESNLIPHVQDLNPSRAPRLTRVPENDWGAHDIQDAGWALIDHLKREEYDLAQDLVTRLLKSHLDSLTLRADLQSLKHWFDPQKAMSSKEAIIVTASSWDPMLLLTVGDLVATGSCQNYRSGSHIHTLLSYVVDANIQAIASFALEARDFTSRRHYEQVKHAIVNKNNVDTELLPNRSWRFTFAPGVFVQTKPIEHAHLRHIIKLGATAEGDVGVRAERGYQQVHGALLLMHRQAQAMLSQLKKDMGASSKADKQPLIIIPGINPGGSYTDAGGGVRTEPYLMPPLVQEK